MARCFLSVNVLILASLAGCSQQDSPSSKLVARAAMQQAPDSDLAVRPKPVPKIYDEAADGFEQIKAAVALAKQSNKRVLLQFGAEWCGWCHRLHRLFDTDERIAQKLKTDYIVILIDVNGDHNQAVDEKYGHPMQHGLPVIVVLDADGNQLATQDTAELEEGDHHDPEKVMAFLEEWSPRA
jgi:thiol:disulfide interchange protein